MMPSNLIAALDNPGRTTFPNLARHGSPEEHPDVTEQVCRELEAAGIEIPSIKFGVSGEVPTEVVGYLGSWKFTRAWYYWIAQAVNGRGIPPDYAHALHEEYGTQVRVEGHCGSPDPNYCRGFAVGFYHIDTQEGLNAFAELLRTIMAPFQKEPNP